MSSQKKEPDFKRFNPADAIPGYVDSANADQNSGMYCCTICRKEYRRLDLELFGKPFRPLPTCKCITEIERKKQEQKERQERKAWLQRTYAKSIVSEDLRNKRLSDFEDRPGSEKAHAKAKEFVETWETRKQGLVLTGPPGNGKSLLARGIEREIDQQGWATLFLDWPQLTVLAKDTFNRNSKVSLADIIRAAVEADLLVLDEIGTGFLTEFEFNDILFPITNGRQGKKTIFTTNLDIDRLDEWFKQDKDKKPLDVDGRLMDRILGSCEIVKNSGTSKRREDALKRMQG